MDENSIYLEKQFAKSNYRSSGTAFKKGNLVKGINAEPCKKIVTSSIPTKFENFVHKNENYLGFNST